jgi:hypothetical protein
VDAVLSAPSLLVSLLHPAAKTTMRAAAAARIVSRSSRAGPKTASDMDSSSV